MADQPNHPISGTPILRPLAEEKNPRIAGGSCPCPDHVLRTALFGIDETWYEAHWYRERPKLRQSRLSSVAGVFRYLIAVASTLRPGSPAGIVVANAIDRG
ncbi:MAG TPA: hypothetical protein VH855_07380 [Acetobacteraceae bacterium]|jgi:hypothetical protein